MPEDVAAAWDEVRSCLSVGASNGAELIARKILLHVAVGFGLPEKDDRGRAPDFASAVARLEEEGLITRRMKPWVDRIRVIGNTATHELPAISEADALDVAGFTEQLLRLAYEMDHIMTGSDGADEQVGVFAHVLFAEAPGASWVS